ncbi:hypothetical protein ACFVT5_12690 [Streptomyces sp. NPDC058001]|uniref:hypothetical protein n=1 Tax=Streptomyces sp. NPDC058001 TaxID=3346300 RepID=UPI0036E6956D
MVVRQHGRTGGALVVAVAVAGLMTGATGCSESGAAAETVDPGDPVDAVHRAAGELIRAGSSKARTAMEMATGGTRVTIRGQGVYDYKDRLGQLRVMLPQDATGATEHRPITELLAPGALYMKNRGAGVPADKWVRVDTASLSDGNLVTGGATDPLAAAELLRGAEEVTFVGETEVAGAPVRHYRGITDLARAAKVSSAETGQALAAAAKGFSRTEVPFDVYLDDQGRVRKLRHEFSFTNAGRKEPVAVASTTLLYDFGTPVSVRLPDERDIYAGKIAEP